MVRMVIVEKGLGMIWLTKLAGRLDVRSEKKTRRAEREIRDLT